MDLRGRHFPNGHRNPTNIHTKSTKYTNFRTVPMHILVIRNVWLDQKSLAFVILGNQRHKKKCFWWTGADLGFCTSTLTSLNWLAHFIHLPLRFNIPGWKFLLLGQMCRGKVFGLICCLPLGKSAPSNLNIPIRYQTNKSGNMMRGAGDSLPWK